MGYLCKGTQVVPFLSVIFAFLISGSSSAADLSKFFEGKKACFLLYDMKAGKLIEGYNLKECEHREPACSTFKFPLAAIAYDHGELKDENTSFKWDGNKYGMPAWEKDQTAATWMQNSVVWVSQAMVRQMGQKTLQTYLDKLKYGSRDLSGGYDSAWLTGANFLNKDPKPTLTISGNEQLEFLKQFWFGKLPVSPNAVEMTKRITYLETSPSGFVLHGKTGSGFKRKTRDIRLGWFIAHVQNGTEEYLGVVRTIDEKPVKEQTFGGPAAKAIFKEILQTLGKW
jgi:beta-lactamase class D